MAAFDRNHWQGLARIIQGSYSGENDLFAPIQRFDSTLTFTPLNIEGNINITSRLEVYPKIDVLFYSFIGPVIELVPYVTGEIHAKAQTQITTTETKNFFAWNSGMNLGFDLRTGLKLSFAGLGEKTLGPYKFPFYNIQVWNAPDSLLLLTTLPNEVAPGDTIDLQFGVMDNLKNYVAGCPIYIEGDGEFSDELFLTGTSGTKNITWIIPEDEDGDGVVKFTSSIFDVDKNVVSEVSDSVLVKNPFCKIDTLIDSRDGHQYLTTKIGEQVWMAENLAWLPEITLITDSTEDGPDVYYNPQYRIPGGYRGTNISLAKSTILYKTYGVSYNWIAAQTACPNGWHLPSKSEWQQLAQFVSDTMGPYEKNIYGWNGVGKHLKATSGWEVIRDGVEGINGTDDFCFNAIPGGLTDYQGYSSYLGENAMWHSTEGKIDRTFFRDSGGNGWSTGSSGHGFGIFGGFAWIGMSVRCIKN